jgi:hypothetical protein
VEGLGPSQVELWTLPDSGTPTGSQGVEEDDTHHRPAAAAAAAAGAAGTHARNSFADQVGPDEGADSRLTGSSGEDVCPAAAVTSVVFSLVVDHQASAVVGRMVAKAERGTQGDTQCCGLHHSCVCGRTPQPMLVLLVLWRLRCL